MTPWRRGERDMWYDMQISVAISVMDSMGVSVENSVWASVGGTVSSSMQASVGDFTHLDMKEMA